VEEERFRIIVNGRPLVRASVEELREPFENSFEKLISE
jgi:hypothetical protein